MSYFADNYTRINYPKANEASPRGLRNAQIGAIHSIASHFTLHSDEPCLIVLPTGTGKTAVLNLSPYVLQAKRVLVLSSSVLVRGQISNEFSSLLTLKNSNVFHADLPVPKVKEVTSPIRTIAEWDALIEYDVVIGIPNSINEGISDIVVPPKDLFDLILVDEAHHVPAFTWSNIVAYFSSASKVFFTATPFRRDKLKIDGRLAYNYPLARAYDDKVFGDIIYCPVIDSGSDPELAIALEAEKVFREDKDAGLRHAMMVRTDSMEHAKILQRLYEEKTSLNLKRVDSSVTYRSVKKTIEELKSGALDGIICVDMMGEGFDFPNLKIAAIHRPKKSLANTLQFIGRFARTNAEDIGPAKFLATPSELKIGRAQLYAEDMIWNDVIKELSSEAIAVEDELKHVADAFIVENTTSSSNDISFFNLNPFCHVKVYWADGLNLNALLEVAGQEVIYHSKSEELNTLLFVTREIEKPKWLVVGDVINIHHYFYLFYYDEDTKLLFIHSSLKSPQFYDYLQETFATGNSKRLSKEETHRVLLDIEGAECFNVGLLNRSANSGESYLTRTGPKADKMILPGDARNYANGHVFLKGNFDSSSITIGYSSGAKVWSNSYQKIPEFIKWCKILSAKIISDREVITNTGFDYLPIGQTVTSFPKQAYAANWNNGTYNHLATLILFDEDEVIHQIPLHDFDVRVDTENSTLDMVVIRLEHDYLKLELSYDFQKRFQLRSTHPHRLMISLDSDLLELSTYFDEFPLLVYLDEFATIANHEYFAAPDSGLALYDVDDLQPYDWVGSNADITVEFYSDATAKAANTNRNSLHECLHNKLLEEGYPVLIYDHGSGEIADFIAFKEHEYHIDIALYHVKGSGAAMPGDRVSDVYEVAMQAVKSQSWTVNKSFFRKKVLDRVNGKSHKFISGDESLFKKILAQNKRLDFQFIVVQPGISQSTFSSKISYILGAVQEHIVRGNSNSFVVMSS